MWDGFFMLLLLCVVMATASVLAGLLPLSFALSQKQLRFITALGTGVLVGTSLIVIIPEGIETVYSASGSSHGHDKRDLSFAASRRQVDYMSPVAEVAWASIAKRDDTVGDQIHSLIPRGQGDFMTGPDDGYRTEEEIAAELSKQGHPSTDPGHEEGSSLSSEQKVKPSSQEHHDEGRNPHAYVGISLIAGFILMYLIDTLPRRASSSSQPQSFQINLTQFSLNRPSTSSPNPDSSPQEPDYHDTPQASSGSSSRPSSTTVGLVIHACADGIALGASSTSSGASSSGRNLSFIIFIALMIHKAPAAFGLTTTLLKQGLSKRAARAHLIVFSLAAPAGALVTWAAASILGYGGLPESMSAEFATGVLLLFSGGTFLYVAMHTMQDGGHAEHVGDGYAEVPMNGYGDGGSAQSKGSSEHGVAETFVTVAGMLLPLLTQFGHAH